MTLEREFLFKGTTPNGRWLVEITAEGTEFICRTTLDASIITSYLRTSDETKLFKWARKEMKDCMERGT